MSSLSTGSTIARSAGHSRRTQLLTMFVDTTSLRHRFGIAGGFDVPGTVVPGIAGEGGADVGVDAGPAGELGGVVGAPGPVPGVHGG
jgi:hypothetical protein